MVQIKDSVLRDSGIRPAFPPASLRRAHLHDAAPVVLCGFGCPVSGPGRMSAPRFWMPDDDSDCQQLVNNLSRVLYVVDFRRVFRPSKKVRKFWENGLTFSKVVHGFRIVGTIQRASSKRSGNRTRGFPAESLLRP